MSLHLSDFSQRSKTKLSPGSRNNVSRLDFLKVAKNCKDIQKVAKIFEKLQRYSKSCEDLQKVAKIFKKLQRYSKSCKDIQKVAKIF